MDILMCILHQEKRPAVSLVSEIERVTLLDQMPAPLVDQIICLYLPTYLLIFIIHSSTYLSISVLSQQMWMLNIDSFM